MVLKELKIKSYKSQIGVSKLDYSFLKRTYLLYTCSIPTLYLLNVNFIITSRMLYFIAQNACLRVSAILFLTQ